MRSRSNSARAANTWKTSLPPLVVVSMLSWRLRNPIPRSRRAARVSTRWRSDRPRRSSFQTTRVSPLRVKARACSRTAARLGTAGGIGGDPLAAGLGQGVVLEVELLVGGGDAGVADEHECLRRPSSRNPYRFAVKPRDLEFGMRKERYVEPVRAMKFDGGIDIGLTVAQSL